MVILVLLMVLLEGCSRTALGGGRGLLERCSWRCGLEGLLEWGSWRGAIEGVFLKVFLEGCSWTTLGRVLLEGMVLITILFGL